MGALDLGIGIDDGAAVPATIAGLVHAAKGKLDWYDVAVIDPARAGFAPRDHRVHAGDAHLIGAVGDDGWLYEATADKCTLGTPLAAAASPTTPQRWLRGHFGMGLERF